MTVEDPHAIDDEPLGPVDPHLPGHVGGQPHIVVAQHHVDRNPGLEQCGEEVEDHGSEQSGRPDDRMLHVARDDEMADRVGRADPDEMPRELGGRGPGRQALAGSGFSQTQVNVGENDPTRSGGGAGGEEQRRFIENRSQRAARHEPGTRRLA